MKAAGSIQDGLVARRQRPDDGVRKHCQTIKRGSETVRKSQTTVHCTTHKKDTLLCARPALIIARACLLTAVLFDEVSKPKQEIQQL